MAKGSVYRACAMRSGMPEIVCVCCTVPKNYKSNTKNCMGRTSADTTLTGYALENSDKPPCAWACMRHAYLHMHVYIYMCMGGSQGFGFN